MTHSEPKGFGAPCGSWRLGQREIICWNEQKGEEMESKLSILLCVVLSGFCFAALHLDLWSLWSIKSTIKTFYFFDKLCDFCILQSKSLMLHFLLIEVSLSALWTFALWLQSLISQDATTCKGLSCPPQIFILLQYQTLAHRIKATALRADNLDKLVRTLAAAGKMLENVFFILEIPSGHHA